MLSSSSRCHDRPAGAHELGVHVGGGEQAVVADFGVAIGTHGLAGDAAGKQIRFRGLLDAVVLAQGVAQGRAEQRIAVAPPPCRRGRE